MEIFRPFERKLEIYCNAIIQALKTGNNIYRIFTQPILFWLLTKERQSCFITEKIQYYENGNTSLCSFVYWSPLTIEYSCLVVLLLFQINGRNFFLLRQKGKGIYRYDLKMFIFMRPFVCQVLFGLLVVDNIFYFN